MNKALKLIDYKLQTVVSSGIILVGVMFLVPTITEKALAVTTGVLTGTCGPTGATHPCEFTFVVKYLRLGHWTLEPPQKCTDCRWQTKSGLSGNEMGSIIYKVDDGKAGESESYFYNPLIGSNECHEKDLSDHPHFIGSCHADSGHVAIFRYHVQQITGQGIGSINDNVATGGNGGSGGDGGHTGSESATAGNGGAGGSAGAGAGGTGTSGNGGSSTGGSGGNGGNVIAHNGKANGGMGGNGGKENIQLKNKFNSIK